MDVELPTGGALVTDPDIAMAFRMILGRPPGPAEREWHRRHLNVESLRRMLLECPEFLAQQVERQRVQAAAGAATAPHASFAEVAALNEDGARTLMLSETTDLVIGDGGAAHGRYREHPAGIDINWAGGRAERYILEAGQLILDNVHAAREEIADILGLLTPHRVAGGRKRRIGQGGDGGYVMLDGLPARLICISAGIAQEVSWDLEMAAGGADVFQYDFSVAAPPVAHDRFHFQPLLVVAQPGMAGTTTLDAMIDAAAAFDPAAGIVLKLDIEGAEWEVLAAADEARLAMAAQIVVELHGLTGIVSPTRRRLMGDALRKLASTHVPIHLHGNNWRAMARVGTMRFPDVLEVTWARRADLPSSPFPYGYPTPLDRPCHPERPELDFNHFPFARQALPTARLVVPGAGAVALTVHGEGDPWISGVLQRGELFDPSVLRALRVLVVPGSVVFDVGANLGWFSIIASRLTGDGGRVVSVEPEPQNVALLRSNLAENGCDNVVVQACAAGVPGMARLVLCAENRGDHRLEPGGDGPSIEVEVRALDAMLEGLEGSVSVIKIDTQGSEPAVLRGMKKLLAAHPMVRVLLEFWPIGLLRSGSSIHELVAELEARDHRLWLMEVDGLLAETTTAALHELAAGRFGPAAGGHGDLLWLAADDAEGIEAVTRMAASGGNLDAPASHG